MYNSAELTAYQIATLRPHDEARRAQLVRQLLSLVEGKAGGHVGRRGFWLPEDQGFTRSADKAVEAWRKYARPQF
jgi:hypothetical protein